MSTSPRVAALSLSLVFVACGGKQVAEVESEPEVVEDAPCCLDDRWEEPPPRVGETPPEIPADEDALEAFEPEGSEE